jgi:mercuric ion binding protein
MKIQAYPLFLSFCLVTGPVFAAPRTVTLDVRNMSCPVCPITVRKALERVSGVQKVTVDAERKTATVEFDDAMVTAAGLTEATKNAGYPSSVLENHP